MKLLLVFFMLDSKFCFGGLKIYWRGQLLAKFEVNLS